MINFDILEDRKRILMYSIRYCITRRSYALSDAKELILFYGKDLQHHLLYTLIDDVEYEIAQCDRTKDNYCKTQLIFLKNLIKEILYEKGIRE
jgi:hypothetical protein